MRTCEQVANGILTINEFLSLSECSCHITQSEELGYKRTTFGHAEQQVSMPRYRNNDRVFFEDTVLAGKFWERSREHVPRIVDEHETIGVSERFRFYRYHKGQFFGRHADGPCRRSNGERSRLTLIVYLNDDFSGGETIFDLATIEPRAGMALIFIHGLMHEGAEVLDGSKYVLRTDVMCAAEPFELDDEPECDG